MLDFAKTLHEAIGIESPRLFIALFAFFGLLFFGFVGWMIDRGYRTKLRLEAQSVQIGNIPAQQVAASPPSMAPQRGAQIPAELSHEAKSKIVLRLEQKYRRIHPDESQRLDAKEEAAVGGMARWINSQLAAQQRDFRVEVAKTPAKPVPGSTAIRLNNATDVTFDNVRIEGFDKAIDATDTHGLRITNSQIIENPKQK